MKITIEHYDKTHTIQVKDNDLKFEETMELIKSLLQSIYRSEIIDEYWE